MDKQFIAKVNGIEIAAVRDEEHNFFVPVRPICDALTLNVSGQIQAVKRHRILGSVVCNLHTTGADGKTYDMVCLPLEFIYGWLWDEWPYLSRFYYEGYKCGQKDAIESLFPDLTWESDPL